jgi:uracil-DNA glycosylase family 4
MDILELNNSIVYCRLCPRLVAWREKVAREKRRAFQNEVYWGKPVPGFGDPHAQVFVVGLAPGAHGSNRTGRQFTGDASGDFLFSALFKTGFASQPFSISRDDGLKLRNLYTAPVCRCAPPGNKPTLQEMANCQPYLEYEFEIIKPKIYVALGRVAYDRILRIFQLSSNSYPFGHNVVHKISEDKYIVCSFHPSRQNTQTGRLTPELFDEVWKTVLATI